MISITFPLVFAWLIAVPLSGTHCRTVDRTLHTELKAVQPLSTTVTVNVEFRLRSSGTLLALGSL